MESIPVDSKKQFMDFESRNFPHIIRSGHKAKLARDEGDNYFNPITLLSLNYCLKVCNAQAF